MMFTCSQVLIEIDCEVIVVTKYQVLCPPCLLSSSCDAVCPNCPLSVRPPCSSQRASKVAEHLLIKVAHVIKAPPDPVSQPP